MQSIIKCIVIVRHACRMPFHRQTRSQHRCGGDHRRGNLSFTVLSSLKNTEICELLSRSLQQQQQQEQRQTEPTTWIEYAETNKGLNHTLRDCHWPVRAA